MNRVIINADDFGIHTNVNQGIIAAHQQGILTSTSLLAGGPAFDEAVELAKTYGTDDSAAFINGILGTLVKNHE